MKSLGNRLMIYFCIIVLFICGGLGIISYNTAAKALVTTVEETLPGKAEDAAKLVKQEIDAQIQLLETVAEEKTIQSMDWEAQLPLLRNYAIWLGYRNLGIASKNGVLKLYDGSSIFIHDRDYFKKALIGNSNISAPLISKIDNSLKIIIAVPVKDDSNIITGVLIGVMDGNFLSRICSQIEFGKSGYSFLFADDGRIIAHPDYNLVDMDNDVINIKSNFELAELAKKMLAGEKGVDNYTYNGEHKIIGFAPVGSTGWAIGVTAEKQEILSRMDELGQVFIIVSLSFIIIGLVLAFYMGRQITTPLGIAARQCQAMARGDFSQELLESWTARQDEIGDLARGFARINSEVGMMLQKIAESEMNLRRITDNMVDQVAQINLEGKYVYVSPSYNTALGWKVEELLGKQVYNFHDPDDVEYTRANYAYVLETGKPSKMVYRFRCVDGNYIWVESIINPLFDNNGNLIGIILAGRDINERKQKEEEMRYMSEHDSLTGLFNRDYFERAVKIIDEQRATPVGIITCDLDGLKLVNDTFGSHQGDELLLKSANLLSECCPEGAILARIGGDEFAILLPFSSDNEVRAVYEKLKHRIIQYNAAVAEIPFSMSMGYAVKKNRKSMLDACQEADRHMCRHKLFSNYSTRSAIVQIVMKALEARDFVTEGHTDRLQNMVTIIAREISFADHEIDALRLLARFHDIGKVGISDNILFKPGKLSQEEYEEMKKHSEIGYHIALAAPDLVHIADWILMHHEWWNGQGYPLGLKGEEIPVECRMLAIADTYDAITSDRPYRKALTHKEAIAELNKAAGIQFDPYLVVKFVQVVDNSKCG